MPPPVSHPTTPSEQARAFPSLVAPLLSVVLPLVIVAIGLSVVLAWWGPSRTQGPGLRVRWAERAEQAGLRFVHRQGGVEGPTTLGGAVVVFDFDQDHLPDLYFVNGAPWPWEASLEKRVGRTGALYRNLGQGQFANVTTSAGLAVELQGVAAAAGDFDSDGRADLMVTGVGTHHLFRNLGQGRFEDVTEAMGLPSSDSMWGSSVAWIDYDGDGWLDLVIAYYVQWPASLGLESALATARNGLSYGTPVGFVGALPAVYRNLQGRRFALVPDRAGLRDLDSETRRPVSYPLAVVPVEANGDTRLDLLFTYQDRGPALFLNRGGRFERESAGRERLQEGSSAGLASASALTFAGSARDPRSQGLFALASAQTSTPASSGIELVPRLAAAVADFDLDGRDEWIVAGTRAESWSTGKLDGDRSGGPPRFQWWDGAKWGMTGLIDVDGTPWTRALATRGVACADFDGDGDVDLVLAQNEAAPLLLVNEMRPGTPWLRLRLVATRSHPDAGGARVEVHTPSGVLSKVMVPAMGYLAQSDSRLTFGLGADARVRRIVVFWPSGQRQEFGPKELNREWVLREP